MMSKETIENTGGDPKGREADDQVTEGGEVETGSAPQQGQDEATKHDGTDTNRDGSV